MNRIFLTTLIAATTLTAAAADARSMAHRGSAEGSSSARARTAELNNQQLASVGSTATQPGRAMGSGGSAPTASDSGAMGTSAPSAAMSGQTPDAAVSAPSATDAAPPAASTTPQ